MKIGGLREDILFKSKEYPLALLKKDSRGDFVFPPGTPLKRPKERPAGLSFGILSEGKGIFVTGTRVRGEVHAVIQGISPCGGRGNGTPSRRALRVVQGSFRKCRGSALSAERVAGQMRFLPDDIRVRHGVQCAEV